MFMPCRQASARPPGAGSVRPALVCSLRTLRMKIFLLFQRRKKRTATSRTAQAIRPSRMTGARGQRPAHPPCQHRQQAQHQDEQHQPERYFQYLAQSLHSFLSLRAVMPGRGTASIALVPLRRCLASLPLPLENALGEGMGAPSPPG